MQNKTIKLTGTEVQKRGMHLDHISSSIDLKSKHLLASKQYVLSKASDKFLLIGKNYLKGKQEELVYIHARIIRGTKKMISYRMVDLKNLIHSIPPHVKSGIRFQKNKLNTIEKAAQFLDPGNVLKRGYSIATSRGQVIKKSSDLSPGDVLKTTYFSGQSISTVDKTE
jgi:exodeoxyribonuclease VII large subunit